MVGNFHRLYQADADWVQGGFDLPDGSRWEYREPGAFIVVRHGWLQVAAVPFTRSHDRLQVLDNAKHMYYSRDRIAVPAGGRAIFELNMAARTVATAPGNLYDGFASWNLLDFESGWAFDFLAGGDRLATVFARLPFPGTTPPDTGPAKAFSLFHELDDVPTEQGQEHAFRITYDQAADSVEFEADGRVVNRYEDIPDKITGFTAALGLMTEIDIAGRKSVSCHGQGVIGRWSPMRVTLAE
ncbi:MAG: hypothetical protein Kow0010_01270 [Dehalococcoidia bacterium]